MSIKMHPSALENPKHIPQIGLEHCSALTMLQLLQQLPRHYKTTVGSHLLIPRT